MWKANIQLREFNLFWWPTHPVYTQGIYPFLANWLFFFIIQLLDSHEWKYQGFFTVFSQPWDTVSSVSAWRVSLVWCPSSQVSADMSLLFGVPQTPQCPPLTVLPECPVSTLPQTFPVFAEWVPPCQTYVTDHSTLWSSATKLCVLDIHLIHTGKIEQRATLLRNTPMYI